jgi:signal transduction histidine kinase/ligand-binding sensor domain-containing protein/AraC-like DNA-binding protein
MRQIALSALLSLALLFPARAQMARLYTTESGLPSSQVKDIFQDSRGFIWISTESGLARFDGMDFTTFRFARDRADALASDLVPTVFEDSRGVLWVGTSMGLQTFNPDNSSFSHIDLRDPEVPGSTQYVSDILEVRTGPSSTELWVATSQQGVYILDTETHALKDGRRGILNRELASPFVNRVFQDASGRVWLSGETGGLSVVDAATMRKMDIPLEGNPVIQCFAEDPESGDVLLGTMNGIYIYRTSAGRIRASADPTARSCEAVALLPYRTSQRTGSRTFLVGTETEGLYVYDSETDHCREASLARIPYGMSRWKVHTLMEDNQGNVWIGAFQTGVLVVPRSMYGFGYLSVGPAGLYGEQAACVTAIVQNPADGSFWIGTDGGGILRVGNDGRRTFFTAADSGLTNDSVMALAFDRDGTLWAATYLDGLFTYTPSAGFRPFADQDAVGSRNVVCLSYDPVKDRLYAGTYGAGLSIISPKARKVEKNIVQDINKWVSALMTDRRGTLWLGTFNGPLCYDPDTGKLLTYNVGNVAINARVYCFYEAKDGTVWIGTGEGLTACDRDRGTTRFFSKADGLSSNVVSAILEAGDGTLWISTSYGLNHLDPATGGFTCYYAYDGLQNNEFHFGSSFRDSDGQLFFGGTGGVTRFYPQVVNRTVHPVPPLSLSKLTVLNEEVDFDPAREDNILDKQITEATRIILPNQRNTFSLEFAVLEYTNPRKIRYAYRLDHFDKDWHYTSPSARTATYTRVPAGRYTFTVKAFFDGAEDDFSSRSIEIRVRYPWYLSVWAFLVYLILLAALALLLKDLYRRHRRHEAEREASEIKDFKLKMFTNISHEIRTPLTLLMSPLKQMREAEQDPRTKGLYNLMYRNSLRILRLVNQLMDMRKVDEGKMQLHFLETDIVYFIRDIMQSFDDMAVSRNIDLTLEPARTVENLWIDQGNFDKIVFNLLSNAFKHTPDGGKITIGVSAPKANPGILPEDIREFVRMDITNSGSRLEAGDQDKIFERFFQSHVLDAKVGSGVGLSLTKMLVELHHGVIEAYNTSSGVRFSVYIPVGCAHLSELEMSRTSHHKDLYTKYPTSDDLTRSTEDLAFKPVSDTSDEEVKSRRYLVIVDDDSEIRDYLLNEFRGKYNVKTFPDAASAWADISVHVPDVVVTDFKMEGMDGIELCEKIKRNPSTNHIPVIILTSSADESTQQRSVDSGADRFLSKPLSIDLLKGSIANILHTRETLRTKYTGSVAYDYTDVKVAAPGALQDRVAEVIKKNLDNSDFGVDDLSREVGMSRVHLNRRLKEVAGISPSALIKSTRMKQAAYLLVHDKVNISEVAYRVGFSTPSYFSSSFRDYFGMTPKEFVAKYIKEDPDALEKLFNG